MAQMTPDVKQALRDRIAARLEELDAEDRTAAGNRGTVSLDQQSVGRLSRMDALQQQAMAQATHARRAAERKRLENTLAMIDTPDFGTCAECGDDIDPRRLMLNPAVALCADCAAAR